MVIGAASVDEVSTNPSALCGSTVYVQEVCTPMRKLYRLLQQDEAQTMTEYATVLTVITIFCLGAFALLAAASTGAISRVASYFT